MDKNIIRLLDHISPDLRNKLKECTDINWACAEEIRLSVGKPAIISYGKSFSFAGVTCSQKHIDETIMLLTDNSLYSVSESVCNGFITIKGGNRAGICGTTVINNGKISAVKEISSINIRIKREVKNCAVKIIDHIIKNETIANTLIISPPQCGKTTLLRDVSRLLGNGSNKSPALNVSLIDERGEIAGVCNGVPENDVGVCTTVLNLCPKSIGISFVIRSMSPDVIITDEIGDDRDAEAVNYAICSGVKIITSAHGRDVEDLSKKRVFKNLLDFFDLFVILDTEIRGNIKSIIRSGNVVL